MKFLMLFVFLFGCATHQKLMKHSEIVKSINSTTEKGDQKTRYDDDYINRKNNLIPDKDFIDFKHFSGLERNFVKAKNIDLSKFKGIDLRYRDTPVKRQWNGTCSTFAGVAALENLMNKPETVNLSERHSWSLYKKYSCSKWIDTLRVKQICDEKYWPQGNTRAYKECKEKAYASLGKVSYIKNDVVKAIEALDKKHVVYLGMSTPKDMLACKKVISPYSKFSNGGHALLINGYKIDQSVKGGGYFIIKNSWGSSCADGGYQYMPFHLCQRSDGYCVMWTIESTNTGNIEPEPVCEVKRYCKRLWWSFWIKKKCYLRKVCK